MSPNFGENASLCLTIKNTLVFNNQKGGYIGRIRTSLSHNKFQQNKSVDVFKLLEAFISENVQWKGNLSTMLSRSWSLRKPFSRYVPSCARAGLRDVIPRQGLYHVVRSKNPPQLRNLRLEENIYRSVMWSLGYGVRVLQVTKSDWFFTITKEIVEAQGQIRVW